MIYKNGIFIAGVLSHLIFRKTIILAILLKKRIYFSQELEEEPKTGNGVAAASVTSKQIKRFSKSNSKTSSLTRYERV